MSPVSWEDLTPDSPEPASPFYRGPDGEQIAVPLEQRIPLYLAELESLGRFSEEHVLNLAYEWTTDDLTHEDDEEAPDLDALVRAACERFGL